jgi:hypothetical protein
MDLLYNRTFQNNRVYVIPLARPSVSPVARMYNIKNTIIWDGIKVSSCIGHSWLKPSYCIVHVWSFWVDSNLCRLFYCLSIVSLEIPLSWGDGIDFINRLNPVTISIDWWLQEEFEDIKGEIRIHISKKNRLHIVQKKKYKRTTDDLQNHLFCRKVSFWTAFISSSMG